MEEKDFQQKPVDRNSIISHYEYDHLPQSEKSEWSKFNNKYEKVPLWSKISLTLAAISAILYIVICIDSRFADIFNEHVGASFRFIFAQITNIFPFSLAEACLILIPVFLFLLIRYVWKFRCNTRRSTLVTLVCIFSVASMFLSSFVLTFSAGYRGKELDEKLGLNAEEIDKTDLYNSAEYLINKINQLSQSITYGSDGFSVMPYTFSEMNDKLIEAYDRFSEKYGLINNFYSRLKPVMLSEAMSYAHITGIYTFFTGESNINIGFPDYTIPYTAAHELAHQRGIAREDEANMMAFLVSVESDDVYIQYCAYVNMYEYITNALYKADKDMYRTVSAKLDDNIYYEQVAYNKFFKKYSQSVTSQVSGAVNNVYLQSQGTEGKKSYGMVVDLAVAYFKSCDLIPESDQTT